MTILTLPGLRSDDPLGVLAALGLLEVATSELKLRARLSWNGLGGPASLEIDSGLTIQGLADQIARVPGGWAAADRVAPPPDTRFIVPPLSAAARKAIKEAGGEVPPLDPMRYTLSEAIARFADQRESELKGDETGARWLAGVVCQLGREQNEPRRELTPLYARTGQQTLHQLYRDYRTAVAREPRFIVEALTSWRRVPDSGANLDVRTLRDATVSTEGKPLNMAAPGAVWLALMAAPFFRLRGDGVRPSAVGWLSARRGGRPRDLFWPVWRQSICRAGVEVLLAHPVVRRAAQGKLKRGEERSLMALGVVAVLRSRRKTLKQSDGPLQAPEVMWPR